MNIVVEKQPKCVATLRVQIPSEKVSGQRDRIVRGYASKVRLPGFRPGKAPRALVEKRFEKEIAEELNEALINEAYDEALKQESLKVLDFGVPENITSTPDGGLSFESTLTLAPDVSLPEYKGITVKVPPTALPEAEIEKQLESLRERLADFTDIEGRGADWGDFAVIDYTSTVEDKPTDEFLGKSAGYLSGRDGFWVRVDEQAFLPGFAAQLIDLLPGNFRFVNLTLPEDFPVADLADKEISFKVTLKELKQAVLPELDDAFAARLAPGSTLDGIKDIIRQNLQGERQRKIDDSKVNQIITHFNELVDFELPEALVFQETQSQANDLVNRGLQSGLSKDEIGAQQAEIFATAGSQAVTNLRTNFILQEIARAEKITVTDAELVNHLARVAAERKVAPKKLIRDLQRSNRLGNVRNSLVIGKAIDFLIEHATVEETADATLDE